MGVEVGEGTEGDEVVVKEREGRRGTERRGSQGLVHTFHVGNPKNYPAPSSRRLLVPYNE